MERIIEKDIERIGGVRSGVVRCGRKIFNLAGFSVTRDQLATGVETRE